ncbi:MAG: hypothetical protein GY936_09550 [Ignavibacteriae bacterium]|nr:hypothetical protein [Ignavibacteriota bacterium]
MTIKGFIDMVAIWFWFKYAARPLHLLGGLGLTSGIYTLYLYLVGKGMSGSAFSMLTMFLLLGDLQMYISGLLADILFMNYFENTTDHSYSIKAIHEA